MSALWKDLHDEISVDDDLSLDDLSVDDLSLGDDLFVDDDLSADEDLYVDDYLSGYDDLSVGVLSPRCETFSKTHRSAFAPADVEKIDFWKIVQGVCVIFRVVRYSSGIAPT